MKNNKRFITKSIIANSTSKLMSYSFSFQYFENFMRSTRNRSRRVLEKKEKKIEKEKKKGNKS